MGLMISLRIPSPFGGGWEGATNVAIARKSRLSEGRAKFTWTMPSMSEFDEVKGRQQMRRLKNGAFRQCEDCLSEASSAAQFKESDLF